MTHLEIEEIKRYISITMGNVNNKIILIATNNGLQAIHMIRIDNKNHGGISPNQILKSLSCENTAANNVENINDNITIGV